MFFFLVVMLVVGVGVLIYVYKFSPSYIYLSVQGPSNYFKVIVKVNVGHKFHT